MPLYEYKCRTCDKVFEVLQKFSDAPVETHEGCGGTVERLISSSAFQFKGSGFYITDYKKKKTSSSEAGKNGESSGSKKESSSESKPAATPAPAPAAASDKKS
jgi:putative FmdB family regulatory protein